MIRNYKIIEKIGKGTFGIIYKVKKFNDPIIYVIKQISLEGLTNYQITQVFSEVKILSLINSKYVVKYYESFLEDDNLNIVMEYCDNGDLYNYLKEKKEKNIPLKEDLIWKIFIKITLGLAIIHKMKILHRDLKTMNIFLTKDMEIKIGDLGVAKELNQASFANTMIGTPYYLSPEICEDKPYNQKSDIWALGVILYELCTFRHPFDAGNQAALILKIIKANPDPILACYSGNLQKIVNNLLEKKVENRPNCMDILNMKIIGEKAKIFGLYHEIVNIYSKSDYNSIYLINENNKNQMENKIPMDSEDILLQSKLIPLPYQNNIIHVKKIKDDENISKKENFIFRDKMESIQFLNQNEYMNNLNINSQKNNNMQYNYMNNFNNNVQISSNYNYYQYNQPNILNNTNLIDYYSQNGNFIINNNNYNNLYNNNNQNNNFIINNIIINNNENNSNLKNNQKFVKVTRVYRQTDIENNSGNFIEDRNLNDINDSLNISVQSPLIDTDRIEDKINFPVNIINNSSNQINNNDINYSSNSKVSMDNYNEDDCPKDNTRNKDKKLKKNSNKDKKENMSESLKNEEKKPKEKVDNKKLLKKSETKSNSFVEKDISPIKLITNTQESINIMENLKNLTLDNIKNNFSKNEETNKIKEIEYKYQKKKLNKVNTAYKSERKLKKIVEEEISDKTTENKKILNKTSENVNSINNFNLNIEDQETIPLSKYLNSINLINSCKDSDSESDFNILRNSEEDINSNENNKRKEQKEFSNYVELKNNENNINKSINNFDIYNSPDENDKNILNEIYNLIGEKDYEDMMNIYSKIKEKSKLKNELEIFIEKKKYIEIKKEKLLDLFLSLKNTF